MHFSTAIAASVLAIVSSVSAAPASPKPSSEKPFKFQIQTNHGTGKIFYLGSEGVVNDKAKAIDCTISGTGGILSCGGKGLTYEMGHTQHGQEHTVRLGNTKSKGFSVDANGVIEWKTSTVINFSTLSPTGTEIFAEVCNGSGHPDKELLIGKSYVSGFVPGVAKAIYA